jgi:hypothetical protein
MGGAIRGAQAIERDVTEGIRRRQRHREGLRHGERIDGEVPVEGGLAGGVQAALRDPHG